MKLEEALVHERGTEKALYTGLWLALSLNDTITAKCAIETSICIYRKPSGYPFYA